MSSFEDPTKRVTLSGNPPAPGMENASAPQPIDGSGMHGDYWVLSPEERAKGFVRPVREKYQHVGIRPQYPVRDLTAEERERHGKWGYVKYEAYPESESAVTGRFWTSEQLRGGCGTVTRMGRALAETYARDPKFYGATFCCGCGKHLPVEEFVWDGTTKVVGS